MKRDHAVHRGERLVANVPLFEMKPREPAFRSDAIANIHQIFSSLNAGYLDDRPL